MGISQDRHGKHQKPLATKIPCAEPVETVVVGPGWVRGKKFSNIKRLETFLLLKECQVVGYFGQGRNGVSDPPPSRGRQKTDTAIS